MNELKADGFISARSAKGRGEKTMGKIINALKAFVSGEEYQKGGNGCIQVDTPELQTRFNFNGEEDLDCSIKRVNGQIEIKFRRREEVR